MIRLLKPLEYYEKKYGTWMYGLNKLYLLMEKQHNRGQEGAGLACVKLEANPGEEYMFRERALGSGAITEIFANVQNNFKDLTPEQLHDAAYAKRTLPFAGEVYMGHLRYSTTGKSGISYVHPFLRRNNWRAKNLALCGNFNMTNVDEIFVSIRVNMPIHISCWSRWDTVLTVKWSVYSILPKPRGLRAWESLII